MSRFQAPQLFRDGDKWCATEPHFTDLQSDHAGFGPTPIDAVNDLEKRTGVHRKFYVFQVEGQHPGGSERDKEQ
jgi:hypothetical protein